MVHRVDHERDHDHERQARDQQRDEQARGDDQHHERRILRRRAEDEVGYFQRHTLWKEPRRTVAVLLVPVFWSF